MYLTPSPHHRALVVLSNPVDGELEVLALTDTRGLALNVSNPPHSLVCHKVFTCVYYVCAYTVCGCVALFLQIGIINYFASPMSLHTCCTNSMSMDACWQGYLGISRLPPRRTNDLSLSWRVAYQRLNCYVLLIAGAEWCGESCWLHCCPQKPHLPSPQCQSWKPLPTH